MKSPIAVEVGKTYDVPCLFDEQYNKWIPVLFPPHRDGKEICVREVPIHYHYDRRFLDSELYDSFVAHVAAGRELCLQKMTCTQEYATSILHDGKHPYFFPMLVRLHELFQNVTMKNNVCPHQGIKVTNTCGTCPGHGLVWDAYGRLKHKLPFFVRVIGIEDLFEIKNYSYTIKFDKPYRAEDIVVELIDNNFNVYPNTTAKLQYQFTEGTERSSFLRMCFEYKEGYTIKVGSKECEITS